MQQIILAIQTPRAGKWNHRWIIPVGCQTDDLTLREALSRFDLLISGDFQKDGIVFHRLVEQPSIGRSAREFIFLYCPGFSNITSTQGKTLCHDALRAYFESQMEQLVTSIDWDNTDGAMIYHSPDLVALYKNLEQAIQQNPEKKIVSDDKENEKPKGKSGCVLFLTLLVAILAVLFYFGRGIINQRPNLNQYITDKDPASNNFEGASQSQDFSDNGNNNTKPVQSSKELSSTNTEFSPGELKPEDYEEWKKLFTLDDENNPQNRYDMVQAAINAAYEYYRGEDTPKGDLTKLSANVKDYGNFTKKLFAIRDKPSKVLYDVESNHDLTFEDSIKGVDPKEFRKTINDLPNVINAVKKMVKQNSKNDIALPSIPNVKPWKVTDYHPNFFFDTDKEIIENICDYIKDVKSNSTIDNVLSQCSAKSHPEFEEYQTWIEFYNKFINWFPDNE